MLFGVVAFRCYSLLLVVVDCWCWLCWSLNVAGFVCCCVLGWWWLSSLLVVGCFVLVCCLLFPVLVGGVCCWLLLTLCVVVWCGYSLFIVGVSVGLL